MKSSTATNAAWVDSLSPKASDRAEFERRFDRILAMNGPGLGRLVATYTHSQSDREDLLQDIAMAIWKALPGFRSECSERTFAFRIAHNRSIVFLVRTQRRTRGSVQEMELEDPSPNAEAGIAREQRAATLR